MQQWIMHIYDILFEHVAKLMNRQRNLSDCEGKKPYRIYYNRSDNVFSWLKVFS